MWSDRQKFNYRLSCACRVVENAFGILANCFRIFTTPISLNPDKVELIVLTCCILHNLLRSKVESALLYMPRENIDTEDAETHNVHPREWHKGPQSNGLLPLAPQAGNCHSKSAKDS